VSKYFETNDISKIIKELLSLNKEEKDFLLKFCELCLKSKSYPHGSTVYINNDPAMELDLLKQSIDKSNVNHTESLTFFLNYLDLHKLTYPYVEIVPYTNQEGEYLGEDPVENPKKPERQHLNFSKPSNLFLPVAYLGSVYLLSKSENVNK